MKCPFPFFFIASLLLSAALNVAKGEARVAGNRPWKTVPTDQLYPD